MRVIVDMPDELVARLDAEAKRLDRPRAWLIRDFIGRGLPNLWQGDPSFDNPSHAVSLHQFASQHGNALRCAVCGGKRGDH